jgi:hypothetical protein
VALVRVESVVGAPRTWAAPGRDALEHAERIRRWVQHDEPVPEDDPRSWLRVSNNSTRSTSSSRSNPRSARSLSTPFVIHSGRTRGIDLDV